MKFTKENWENAPEGATLEHGGFPWEPVEFIGFNKADRPVVENSKGCVWAALPCTLRIVLPKRKVTVQLWQRPKTKMLATKILGVDNWTAGRNGWDLIGEHTFEVEGE